MAGGKRLSDEWTAGIGGDEVRKRDLPPPGRRSRAEPFWGAEVESSHMRGLFKGGSADHSPPKHVKARTRMGGNHALNLVPMSRCAWATIRIGGSRVEHGEHRKCIITNGADA